MRNIELFRKKIRSKCSQGTWMQINSQFVAKNLAQSNAEWIVLDLEHGFFSLDDIPAITDIIKSSGKLVFARLCENSHHEVKKVLEAGCDGIIFPRIDCKKKLNELILHALYPPMGKRSYGFSYDNNYGKQKFQLNKPFLVVMIENVKGVKDSREILDNKNLDAVIIGNYDLHLDWKSKKKDFKSLEQMHQIVFDTAKKLNKAYGIHIVEKNSKTINKYKKLGCKFLPISIDTIELQNIL